MSLPRQGLGTDALKGEARGRGVGVDLQVHDGGLAGGLGGLDVWIATRASINAPWSQPVNLGAPVNSSANEGGPALSFDGTTLYFYSTRAGGSGSNDLYVTSRTKLRGDHSH